MDWQKVKKYLISIFLIINAFLFTLNYRAYSERYRISIEDENRIRQIMGEEGIITYHKLPDNYPLPQLKMQEVELNQQKIVNQVFNKVPNITYSKNKTTYTNNNEILEFNNDDKKITYLNEDGKFEIKNYAKDSFKIANQFANWIIDKEYDIKPGTWQLDSEGNFIYNFYEVFKGYDIYSSYISVKVTEDGVTEAEIVRYEPIEFEDKKWEIYPIDEILYNVLYYIKENVEGRPIIIDYIGIGYYIENNARGDISIANPYYNITLNCDGGITKTILIDAYTNEIIQEN